ncbi:hypothetical protein FALCPG4_018272 [Fusarium falciforme]
MSTPSRTPAVDRSLTYAATSTAKHLGTPSLIQCHMAESSFHNRAGRCRRKSRRTLRHREGVSFDAEP